MQKRWGSVFAIAAIALGLTACGDAVKFPGLDEEPAGPGEPYVPPPPPTEPTNPWPTDTSDTGSVPADPVTPIDTDPVDTTDTPDPADPVGPTVPSDPDPIDPGPDTDTGTDTNTDADAPDGTNPDPADTDPVDPPPPPADPDPEPVFSYHAPGALLNGTGDGAADRTVYAPDIVFPIKDAPTFLQSMVFRPGGGVFGGDQCDPTNYEYPWRDNFCETRTSNYNTAYCPTPRVHLGQDIRVGDAAGCQAMRSQAKSERGIYEVVAVEDGIISNVGTYTVNVRAGGRIYRYMHMNMRRLQVSLGDEVKAGDILGFVSNDFGRTATTIHLHFEIKQNTAENGWAYVPPYLSLVEAYERREQGPGEELEAVVNVATRSLGAAPEEPAFTIPEGMVIIE